ncbi:MAG: TatD family hydrolase [Rhodothermales bacterium]|nr:TatD family hydrolase [Rhodothermales bacterium]
MLIDTHVHIYHEKFDDDRDAAIMRAYEAGVKKLLLPAIDIQSIHDALDLGERYDGVYAMAAIHPSETKDASDHDFAEVVELCNDPRVVAVGESGLDYYWDRSFDERQQEFLRLHARLAIDRDLPLILHNREAGEDLVRILQEEKRASPTPERLRGVFHCFGGPAELAGPILDLGFHFGIGGTLTFKNSGVADVVRELPIDRIVLETDAPFLAPAPYRGKRNEPAYVRLVAEKLAEVMELSVDEVARITSANASALFGI